MFCIIYLASPRERRIYGTGARKFDILRASLRITRECFPDTDIYVFHEDYTEEEFALCPEVTEFIQVDFSGGDEHYVKYTFPKGYMMMCRFFSGIVQNHPILEKYSHYMRLDDDSYFTNPKISPQWVENHISHDYVYRSLFRDLKNHQSLYEFTLNYLQQIGSGKYIPELERRLKAMGFLSNMGYTGLAPYNNFHLASLRLWKHPIVTEYLRRIEDGHYILRRGWLDANIHAMIVFVLAPFIDMQVQWDGTFGYRHNKHVCVLGGVDVYWDDKLPFHPQFSDLPPCE